MISQTGRLNEMELYEILSRLHDPLNGYVRDRDFEELSSRVRDRDQKIIDGLQLSRNPRADHSLVEKCLSGADVRTQILYALGFRARELDSIFENVNLYANPETSQGLPLPRIFSSGGSKNRTSAIRDRMTAVYISAALETPISVLTQDIVRGPGPAMEACWFREIKPWDLKAFQLPEVQTLSYPGVSYAGGKATGTRQTITKGIHIGTYKIEDLQCDVGVTVLYTPGYVQVSMFVAELMRETDTNWPHRLVAFASDIGIAGPSVYTVATPFLSEAPLQIHRMSWLTSGKYDPQAELKLYTRVFSPRTTEVSIWSQPNFVTYKRPLFREREVIRALRALGIIRSKDRSRLGKR